jgi:UTP--glucose-1-phosphate uridylyltransferase
VNSYFFSRSDLEQLGLLLLPYTAYGVLNGGSATSFADNKKNKNFCPDIFPLYEEYLATVSPTYEGKPKGITPAFLGKDGKMGPSFLELKIRDVMIQCLQYQKSHGPMPQAPAFFQMTSDGTHDSVMTYLENISQSPLVQPLIEELGWNGVYFRTAKQELISTFTLPDEHGKSEFFTLGSGADRRLHPLPGGHGQNFRVLREVYQALLQDGYRYAYLGNVDNLGYIPNLEAMARLHFSGYSGGFEFSYRTKMDVKGGVLVQDPEGKLSTKDLGVSISHQEAEKQEQRGGSVLFNCATGLFDLNYLVSNLPRIISNLPLRLSRQDKDLGQYLQAEQVTWEVMELMDKVMIFGIDKSKRFLSAKLLMETFLTSGLNLDHPLWDSTPQSRAILQQAIKNRQGLLFHLQQYSRLDPQDIMG